MHVLGVESVRQSFRTERGFTLIELVMVIVILGVLAVFAAPMFNATMFNARGFHDETLSLLRYAQKAAIAQRRTVCVTFTSTSVNLTMASSPSTANCASSTALTGPNGATVVTAASGASFYNNTAPTNFNFDGLGQPITGAVDANGVPITANKQTIKINDATDIVVESITGYVHD